MLKFYLSQSINHAASARHGFLRCCGLVKPLAQCKPALSQQQRGFTLLELLAVVAILGIIALAATTYIIDTGELRRQVETESRWDAIRKAIIGEPNLTLNGSPYLSSYVADMGRLPSNIQELFIRGTQPAWTEIALYKKEITTDCTTAPEDCYWFGGGWRGPYLYTAGSRFFRDGWGNEDFIDRNDGIDDDATNFGWLFKTNVAPPYHTDIAIQSLGDINTVGGTGFLEDFPADDTLNMVQENEWVNSNSNIQFNVRLNKAVTTDVTNYLRIYHFVDDGDDLTPPEMSEEDSEGFILPSGLNTAVTLTILDGLPTGRYAAVIFCDATFTNVFDSVDGTCDSTNEANPYIFTLLPHISVVELFWNLP